MFDIFGGFKASKLKPREFAILSVNYVCHIINCLSGALIAPVVIIMHRTSTV